MLTAKNKETLVVQNTNTSQLSHTNPFGDLDQAMPMKLSESTPGFSQTRRME